MADEEELLNSDRVLALVTKVEEVTRSTDGGVKHFIEPARGTLSRATSRRHHLIFGRRRSGKSSLLRKAAADLALDRRPNAYVNLEAFKGSSYPDVLLSVLISTFERFNDWLETTSLNYACQPSFGRKLWQQINDSFPKLFRVRPSPTSSKLDMLAALSVRLRCQIEALKNQLHATDAAQITVTAGTLENVETVAGVGGRILSPVGSASAAEKLSSAASHREEIAEQFKRSKIDFLRHHIMEYQRNFLDIAELSSGDSYLLLDDLYHIRRRNQPQVIDYLHRMAKDHKLWLKIGTIRHRTEWYFHTDPPVGIKLGDDADQIDLDMTLERYSIAKEFLLRILADLAHECDVEIAQLMTEGAVDRLVLASGGVARDFLAVFRMSVDVSRERIRLHEQHGNRINVEDVNVAAGEFESSKREEFKRDTSGEDQGLEQEFQRIRNFCLEEAESNCFLLDADAKGSQIDLIHELADLKLLHRARAHVSVSGRPGKIFEAYMLDLSQYAGSRKRRGVTVIEFWNPRVVEDLSKVSLIYELAPAGESRSPSPPLARQEHQALDDGPDGDEQQADSASPENGDQPAPSSR